MYQVAYWWINPRDLMVSAYTHQFSHNDVLRLMDGMAPITWAEQIFTDVPLSKDVLRTDEQIEILNWAREELK